MKQAKTSSKKAHAPSTLSSDSKQRLSRKKTISYSDMFDLVRPPREPRELDKLWNEFRLFVLSEDTICIEDFPIRQGIGPTAFFRTAESNDKYLDILDLVEHTISCRLQKLVHTHNYEKVDKDLMLKVLPTYNRRYKSWELERIKKNAEGKQSGSIQVIMPAIANSPLVPERDK